MSILIICEKPSVAKTIAGALGAKEQKDGYIQGNGLLVSWCIGHLVSMADAGSYDERFKKWRYEDLPILPEDWKYTLTPGKEKQFAVLKELMLRADVSGHYHNGAPEIRPFSVSGGESPLFEYLKKQIQHVRVSLLDLVEKHD